MVKGETDMGNNGNGLHEWYDPAKALRVKGWQAGKVGWPWRKWIVAGVFCLVVVLSIAILLSGDKSAFVLTNWMR